MERQPDEVLLRGQYFDSPETRAAMLHDACASIEHAETLTPAAVARLLDHGDEDDARRTRLLRITANLAATIACDEDELREALVAVARERARPFHEDARTGLWRDARTGELLNANEMRLERLLMLREQAWRHPKDR